MKLIGSDTSPYVRKVRIVLQEKGIACDYLREDVWKAETAIRATNPLAKVPALVLDDGAPILDSPVIVEYLDSLGRGEPLIPAGTRARAEARTIEALADGILDAAILIRLESVFRAQEQHNAAWLERQNAKIHDALTEISRRLGKDAGFDMACDCCLADIATGCALGYLDFRFGHIDWRAAHPNLATLQTRLMARPSFQATAPA